MRAGWKRTALKAVAIATAANRNSRIVLARSLSAARNTERITIGPISPMAPTASTVVPKRVLESPASWRMGTRTPSAVVASAMPTTSGSSTIPASSSPKPMTMPSTSPISHPEAARRIGAPAIRRRSISRPARKNRAASPRLARKSTNSSGSAMSSTSGPMMIPRRISTTTVAIRALRGMSAMIGAATATQAQIVRVARSGSTGGDSQSARRARPPGGQDFSRTGGVFAAPDGARGGFRSGAAGRRNTVARGREPHCDRDFVRTPW